MSKEVEMFRCEVPVEREFLPSDPTTEVLAEFGATPRGWKIVDVQAVDWLQKSDTDGFTYWTTLGVVKLTREVSK